MKKLLISIILLLPILSFGQQANNMQIDSTITYGHFKIKNSEFTFKKIEGGFYYNEKGEVDTLADYEDNVQFVLLKNNKPLLAHTLSQSDGDCNSISLKLGDYALTDSSIILYSYYAWVGGCCGLPYGAREQVYKVNAKGNLYLYKSEIYLERYTEKVSDMDSEFRKKWISETEKDYNAKFVLGEKADRLMKTVKQRLAKQIAAETKGWEKDPHGYRR